MIIQQNKISKSFHPLDMLKKFFNKEIHLYSLIIPGNFEGFSLKTCETYLSEEDVAKYSKLKVRGKKKELLVSRVFLWNVLERYLAPKTCLDNFSIKKNYYGKPYLFFNNERFPLYFNLSHTKGLICCAVSLHHPLGVDVEYMDRNRACFIEDYLSLVEKEKFQDIQGNSVTRLYELWTLKEAYLKADGRGLSVPLDSFGFIFDQELDENKEREQIRIQFYDTGKEQTAGQWFFRLYQPTRQHSMAVAVRMETSPLFRSFIFSLDDLVFTQNGYL